MNNKILKILKYLIGWPLSIISIFFILKLIVSNKGVLLQIENVNLIFLLVSILLFLTYFLLRGISWQLIIKSKDNKFSLLESLYYWEMSEIKRYTPGNIWAFLSRNNYFTKNNINKKNLLFSLLIEIVLIVLSCLILSMPYLLSLFTNDIYKILLIIAVSLLILIFLFYQKLLKLLVFAAKASDASRELSLAELILNNSQILIFSLLAFFCFGLATFFGAISIIPLGFQNLTEIVSLFIFALLIGYISIITPMGLGVREGVTTYGLTKFTTLSQAAIIAIFTRILFILSEVLFFVILLFLHKQNKQK